MVTTYRHYELTPCESITCKADAPDIMLHKRKQNCHIVTFLLARPPSRVTKRYHYAPFPCLSRMAPPLVRKAYLISPRARIRDSGLKMSDRKLTTASRPRL